MRRVSCADHINPEMVFWAYRVEDSMKNTQSQKSHVYWRSNNDYFFNEFSEKLLEERKERRRSYITAILMVACVYLTTVLVLG